MPLSYNSAREEDIMLSIFARSRRYPRFRRRRFERPLRAAARFSLIDVIFADTLTPPLCARAHLLITLRSDVFSLIGYAAAWPSAFAMPSVAERYRREAIRR